MILVALQDLALAPDPSPLSARALIAVVITLGLLAAAAWALRTSAGLRRAGQVVRVETAVPLGERRSLVIVAVEGRRLLLGMTPGQITLVTELKAPFSDALAASLAKGEAS